MIAEQLRKSVLQAAIQGKLTEQLPEDGDARDLLKEIQKEKQRLIKEGKIKKDKPLPEITEDESPFDIPANWCWVRLKEVAQVINGDRSDKYPGKEHWTSSGVPFINAGCLSGKYLSDTDLNFIPRSRFNMLRSGFIDIGDILYCLRGSLGKLAINKDFREGAIASSLSIIRLFGIMSVDYLYYVLKSPLGGYLLNEVNNGTAQPNLSAKSLASFVIPLPPLSEQRRIVERLEEVLPVIDKLAGDEIKLDELLMSFPKKMKDAVLQAAIQGKLTEQLPEDGDARDLLKEIQKEKQRLIKEGKIKKDKPLPEIAEDEIPFEIPANWCWVRLGEIGSSFSDGVHFAPKYYASGVPCISAKDIYNDMTNLDRCNYISEADYQSMREKINIQRGSLLFTKSGSIGRTCIVDGNQRFGLVESVGVINLVAVQHTYVKFIFDLIFDGTGVSNQYTQGIGVKHLTLALVRNILVPLPPLMEQQRIVERLEGVLPAIDKLEKSRS